MKDSDPVDIGRKLNVHKTFRRRPGRLLDVLYTFSLRPVSTGEETIFSPFCGLIVCRRNIMLKGLKNVKDISQILKNYCSTERTRQIYDNVT